MEFLFGLMRTLVVARYAADGDSKGVRVRAGLMYKVNLLFVLPLLIISILKGDAISAELSAGRYGDAHWLLVGWLTVLLALAHHRITDLLAHTLGKPELTRNASFYLLVTPIAITAATFTQEWGLLFMVLFAAEAAYSLLVLHHLRSDTRLCRTHWIGVLKFGLAGIIAAVLVCGLNQVIEMPLLIELGIVFGIVWGSVAILQAWTREEAELVRATLQFWRLPKGGPDD